MRFQVGMFFCCWLWLKLIATAFLKNQRGQPTHVDEQGRYVAYEAKKV